MVEQIINEIHQEKRSATSHLAIGKATSVTTTLEANPAKPVLQPNQPARPPNNTEPFKPKDLSEVVSAVKKQIASIREENPDEQPLTHRVEKTQNNPEAYAPSRFAYANTDQKGYQHSNQAPSNAYQSTWYSTKEAVSNAAKEAKGMDLSRDEESEVQENIKLKNMSLGGSGKHISLRAQEIYQVKQKMTYNLALNMITYTLRLG